MDNGGIEGGNRFEKWENGLKSYNANDAFVLFSRREKGKPPHFIQPSFAEIERIDKTRLNKQMKGIITILEEMKEFDRHLLPADRSVTPMLEDSKKLEQVYLTDGNYKTKRLVITRDHTEDEKNMLKSMKKKK